MSMVCFIIRVPIVKLTTCTMYVMYPIYYSVGTPTLREMVDAGAAAEDIIAAFQPDVLLFRQRRKQYLLY